MDRETYIKDKAQWLVGQVSVDGDDLDLYLIENILEEVFQSGYEEGKKEK
jgi:hypothetical protein